MDISSKPLDLCVKKFEQNSDFKNLKLSTIQADLLGGKDSFDSKLENIRNNDDDKSRMFACF